MPTLTMESESELSGACVLTMFRGGSPGAIDHGTERRRKIVIAM